MKYLVDKIKFLRNNLQDQLNIPKHSHSYVLYGLLALVIITVASVVIYLHYFKRQKLSSLIGHIVKDTKWFPLSLSRRDGVDGDDDHHDKEEETSTPRPNTLRDDPVPVMTAGVSSHRGTREDQHITLY